MTREVYSHCRGCVSSCGLVFQVDDNRIVSHRANRDSLISEGFKCVKGDMSVEFLNAGEPRLTECRKRTAAGEFAPIASDLVMDEVAAQIAKSIAEHGPRSVALYMGTAAYRKSFTVPTAKQLMAAIGSPNVFTTMTIDQSAHWVVDGRMGTFATGRPFFQDVDVIVVSGTNPVVTHSSGWQAVPLVNQVPKLRAFRERGGKLIVVDPRKTETARLADVHLQVRPGTDTEVFACLNRLILRNGWHDEDFCRRFVTNLDALRQAIEPYTVERVSKLAGVTPEALEEAARLIGHARKLSAGFGTGTAMSPAANTAAHMIEAMNAICGGYARAGDTVHNPGIFAKRPTEEAVNPPKRTWETGLKLRSGHGQVCGEFPTSRLPDEILTPGPEQIRTLIVLGANPMVSFGEPARLREALNALDCLIVVDARMTETAELAHYIVAPSVQYEVYDINLFFSGRNETPVIQYTEPVVTPPPGVINEWRWLNGLANRLGHTLRLVRGTAPPVELDPATSWDSRKLVELTLAGAGTSLDEVQRHPHGMRVEMPHQTISTAKADDGARLDVCPPDVADELRDILEQTPQQPGYVLVARRIVETMNSEFRFAATTQRRYDGAAPLWMHPEDMAAEGIAAKEMVVIRGKHGELRARARPDPTLRRGVLSMPHCWNGDPDVPLAGGHTSWLVSMRPEDTQIIDGMPQQSSLSVTLHRLPATMQ